ncbi:MAG: aromatic-ring-hydroxylating dioxygenase subunit beta [Natronospirillum sp.]|uniref:aromatic-ring-hydroxylating dioxygenase subunit beta n=1 Tax=Natronospirillum sp. TaxID=2812955 RepID=UPI0025FDD03B|nr:aromatic-ring-hydroxylating dioxygenase subunit beta [Natronospirillum sp.]MCH8551919.1 aromatic-ring-hydroxylating dioxygenase subunit beta [Natronospirillum sp.]
MMDFATYHELQRFYSAYAECVDHGDLDDWPEFFLDQCVYRVQARENFDRGFPLAVLSLESKGMLKDRVYGVKETLFHDPYYQRHIVSAPLVHGTSGDLIVSEANYVVVRTKPGKPSEVYNAGRYLDRIQQTPDGLRFAQRICVYDSELIPNSMVYPI